MKENDLQVWFKMLSRRYIKELNLLYDGTCGLPLTYLLDGTCGEHLVELNIKCRYEDMMIVSITSMLRFARLERVNLTQVEITDDGEPISSIVGGSPCLRELVLFQCKSSVMNLRCSTLKILKLVECDFLETNIGVPNLEHFELILDEDGLGGFQFVIDDMPCLSKAKVMDCGITAAAWSYIFHKIQHVIKLDACLSSFVDDDSPTEDFKLPSFERLKCLEIRCFEEHSLQLTRNFLSYMPACVSLIIHMIWWYSCSDLPHFLPEKNSSSLGLHVEYIEIYGIGKTRLGSVELLRYLLDCFKGLKEVKLHLADNISSGWKNMMPKTIMNLPRPSACKIIICDLPS